MSIRGRIIPDLAQTIGNDGQREQDGHEKEHISDCNHNEFHKLTDAKL